MKLFKKSEGKGKANNNPIANPDKLVLEGEEIAIDEDSVLLNDSDPDGDILQILIYRTVYGDILQLNDGTNYVVEINYQSVCYYIWMDTMQILVT